MYIFPAIDIYEGKAVRLFKGNYDEMTVYSDDPVSVARDFKSAGASHIHLVDLEGARYGEPRSIELIKKIISEAGLFCEVGGGIRSADSVKKYIEAGANRVILGTAAVTDEKFLKEACSEFESRIAVGVDIKDGMVAIKGWSEKSVYSVYEFCDYLSELSVKNIICTDISRDGAMKGANIPLYKELSEKYPIDITASGGVSSLDDIKKLKVADVYAAIIGKAYYTKAIDLNEAVKLAETI